MSIDANDWIDDILDEQARRNSAFVDQPDIDQAVEDYQSVTETVGLVETLNRTTYAAPHVWGNAGTIWGFWGWGN